jgi:hypothetical protein
VSPVPLDEAYSIVKEQYFRPSSRGRNSFNIVIRLTGCGEACKRLRCGLSGGCVNASAGRGSSVGMRKAPPSQNQRRWATLKFKIRCSTWATRPLVRGNYSSYSSLRSMARGRD